MAGVSNAEIWNLISGVASLLVLFYAYRIYRTFKGGKLGRSTRLTLWAILTLLATFFLSLFLDLENINATLTYGVSIKDLGVLVAIVFMGLSLRDSALFWSVSTTPTR